MLQQAFSTRMAALADKDEKSYTIAECGLFGGCQARRLVLCVEVGDAEVQFTEPGAYVAAPRDRCTTGSYRRISGSEHQAVLENMQRRLDKRPMVMQLRQSTGEQLFGTIKVWIGATATPQELTRLRQNRVITETRSLAGHYDGLPVPGFIAK